jgi:hypothetical protein
MEDRACRVKVFQQNSVVFGDKVDPCSKGSIARQSFHANMLLDRDGDTVKRAHSLSSFFEDLVEFLGTCNRGVRKEFCGAIDLSISGILG